MTREEIAVGRSAAERIIEAPADLQFAMSQKNRDAAELAFEIASTGARTLHVLINGAVQDHRIELAADDLKLLERGGSIDCEIRDGKEVQAVVSLSRKREPGEPRYRQRANAVRR
jgi:hypothetical protein